MFHDIPISASLEGILSYDSSVFKRSRSGSCTLNFDIVLVAEQRNHTEKCPLDFPSQEPGFPRLLNILKCFLAIDVLSS